MSDEPIGVRTEKLSLKGVLSYKNSNDEETGVLFRIPSYQRPYVWSNEDAIKLFEDIKNACFRNEMHYFIGTTLSSYVDGTEDKVPILELVDGQQRTTTLMLICLALKNANNAPDLLDLAVFRTEGKYKDTPRLQFEIREEVQQYFGAKADLPDYQEPSLERIENNPYLTQVASVFTVLEGQVDILVKAESESSGMSSELVSTQKLSAFIYEKVQWVNNIMPRDTDLNRLFATMNTAGVQLEQSDILKAKLLQHIGIESRPRYAAMWAACEHMENYFERNVWKAFPETNWNDWGERGERSKSRAVEPSDLAAFDERLTFKASERPLIDRNTGKTIAELQAHVERLNPEESSSNDKGGSKGSTGNLAGETGSCRSIVSFSLLLIHAYRIFLLENKSEEDIKKAVHSKYLLEIFEPLINLAKQPEPAEKEAKEQEVKAFFEMLWQTRYTFDRWVVKWVAAEGETEQRLRLKRQKIVSASKGSNRRIDRDDPTIDAMLMLQSVRYFTGDRNAQYWLTPFLAKLLRDKPENDEESLKILERIDNQMSLATVTRKDATFTLAREKGPELDTISWAEQKRYFHGSLGTGFQHYWFQKLEYILWKRFSQEIKAVESGESSDVSNLASVEHASWDGKAKEKFAKYRITSKNSVEHVHSQKEENKKILCDCALHAFGNLALLSPGENSSYSNQNVWKKFGDFDGKESFDSLKLRELFRLYNDEPKERTWTADKISKHQKLMLEALASHYGEGKNTSGFDWFCISCKRAF